MSFSNDRFSEVPYGFGSARVDLDQGIFLIQQYFIFCIRSLGACVHINAAILGFGASNDQRKLYSVAPSVAMAATDFPDTTESPESEASKRARRRMNWEDENDEGDDDVDEDSDEV